MTDMALPIPVSTKAMPLFGCANVNSLLPKLLHVSTLLDTYKFAAFGINESKLAKEIGDTDILIPSYHIFRRDVSRNKHGVALYVRKCFNPVLLKSAVPAGLQLVAVSMKLGKKKLIVATIYRPPKNDVTTLDNFFHSLSDWLASLGSFLPCWIQH